MANTENAMPRPYQKMEVEDRRSLITYAYQTGLSQ